LARGLIVTGRTKGETRGNPLGQGRRDRPATPMIRHGVILVEIAGTSPAMSHEFCSRLPRSRLIAENRAGSANLAESTETAF